MRQRGIISTLPGERPRRTCIRDTACQMFEANPERAAVGYSALERNDRRQFLRSGSPSQGRSEHSSDSSTTVSREDKSLRSDWSRVNGRERVEAMIENRQGASPHPHSSLRHLRHWWSMYRLFRLPVRQTSTANAFLRTYASRQTAPSLTEGEKYIFDKLTKELKPSELLVQDVSGQHAVCLLFCFILINVHCPPCGVLR